jgi:hypothetical protein
MEVNHITPLLTKLLTTLILAQALELVLELPSTMVVSDPSQIQHTLLMPTKNTVETISRRVTPMPPLLVQVTMVTRVMKDTVRAINTKLPQQNSLTDITEATIITSQATTSKPNMAINIKLPLQSSLMAITEATTITSQDTTSSPMDINSLTAMAITATNQNRILTHLPATATTAAMSNQASALEPAPL